MIRRSIRSGQFSVELTATTPAAQACLEDFIIHRPASFSIEETPGGSSWMVHIVADEPSTSVHSASLDERWNILAKLHLAFQSKDAHRAGSFYSLQSEHGQPETEFIHLISSDRSIVEERVILTVHLAKVLQRWLMVHGNISLHASTLVRGPYGFMFLGQSGAGKSTVAQLSQDRASILNDEKIFLTSYQGRYLLSRIPTLDILGETVDEMLMMHPSLDGKAFKYGITEPALSGIFLLKQDTRDFLLPLTPLKAAQALMESLFQLPRIFTLSKSELRYALRTLSRVAREIPAYELHFRKSPDFWELIDAQFPG